MDKESRDKLIAAGRTDLVETYDLMQSGYAGINQQGTIVDRRQFPNAIPIQENSMLKTSNLMDNTTTNVQGWISVKDRKPEAGITVIGGHAEHNWVCGVEFDGKQWYNQFDESDVPVYPTHWQLMPKPPIKSGLVVSEGLIDTGNGNN